MSQERSLPDFIQGYLDYTEGWNEAPESFRVWTAVSTISAALQRRVRLSWGFTLYPNEYILLVAPPGAARKGTAMNPAHALLREVGIDLAANTTTRAALIRRLKQVNYTDQALGPVYSHSSLTVFSKEFTVFLGYNNQQLMSDLCDLYDCDDNWEYDTKDPTKKDTITNVWLNLIGATTPQTLKESMPMDLAAGGLLSRIVTVYENEKNRPIVFPLITKEEKEIRQKLKEDLEQIKLLTGDFKWTKGFKELYKPFYERNHENPPFQGTILDSYPTRRPIHLLKLCMVCSVSRSPEMVIREKDIIRAMELLTKAEGRMLEAYRGMGQADYSDVLDRVMQLVAVRKKLLKNDIARAFYNDADPEMLEKIIATMEMIGFARRTYTNSAPPKEIITYIEEFDK